MKIFTTAEEINKHYERTGVSSPGFVPTMGALHEGHLSLVNQACAENIVTAVSIFVNPTQFNDPEDLKKYPRTPADDLEMLSRVLRDDDYVFMPDPEEIYPEPDIRIFDFGDLERVMEGVHRPGHFNGVAQVVSRLFTIVRPGKAYFGQKDFQQLTIIRELSRRSFPEITVVPCPIVREPDGLAMSSRNRRLLPEHRARAAEIFRAISDAASEAAHNDIADARTLVSQRISAIPGFRLEYFEIVDELTLKPLNSRSEAVSGRNYFGCIALFAGAIRLIDNVPVKLI